MSLPLENARSLLGRARDDAYVVRRLSVLADAPQWVLGFHAQQAVEKALKAVLSGHGISYPRTHNLVMLMELLRSAGVTVPPDEPALGLLTAYGVLLRYDDNWAEAPAPVDETLIGVVERTLEWAQACLQALRE